MGVIGVRFAVYGPFELPRKNRCLVTRDARKKRSFWETVNEADDGLADACGCYAFSIPGRPWYVGLAEKQSFRDECFTPQKITNYDSALSQGKGRPMLLLIAKFTPSDWWAKPSKKGQRDIQMLETLLIGMAVTRNPKIENIRGTKPLRELNVPGVLNSRKGQGKSNSVRQLRKALGI